MGKRRTNGGFTFGSPSRKYTRISPLRPTASGPFALSKLLIFLGRRVCVARRRGISCRRHRPLIPRRDLSFR